MKRTLHTMEQTLTELQSKYAYGIGKRLPSALRQSQASFIAIEPAGKDELALMRATHAEEMNTLRAQFRHVLSRALLAAAPSSSSACWQRVALPWIQFILELHAHCARWCAQRNRAETIG